MFTVHKIRNSSLHRKNQVFVKACELHRTRYFQVVKFFISLNYCGSIKYKQNDRASSSFRDLSPWLIKQGDHVELACEQALPLKGLVTSQAIYVQILNVKY